MIDQMETDWLLDRNWVKGALGDAMCAVRRRPQPEDDSGAPAGALLRPCQPDYAGHDDRRVNAPFVTDSDCALKTGRLGRTAFRVGPETPPSAWYVGL